MDCCLRTRANPTWPPMRLAKLTARVWDVGCARTRTPHDAPMRSGELAAHANTTYNGICFMHFHSAAAMRPFQKWKVYISQRCKIWNVVKKENVQISTPSGKLRGRLPGRFSHRNVVKNDVVNFSISLASFLQRCVFWNFLLFFHNVVFPGTL